MTQAGPDPRPPWLATWLVEMFASADQAESILGDLHEEFSEVASKSGVAAARRWYWRQSVKTICHLSGAAFRNAPWSIAEKYSVFGCGGGASGSPPPPPQPPTPSGTYYLTVSAAAGGAQTTYLLTLNVN